MIFNRLAIMMKKLSRWNYGGLTQASEKEDEAGYTEFGAEDSGVYSGNSGTRNIFQKDGKRGVLYEFNLQFFSI